MKRFRPRPYDPDRQDNPATPAQQKARERNFRIFQLRGLASFRFMLTGERREALVRLVDEELAVLGAETQAARIVREREEFERLMDGE